MSDLTPKARKLSIPPLERHFLSSDGILSTFASYLGLTAEQTQQLQGLRKAQFKEMAPLQGRLFSKRQELRLLWANPNADHVQILAKQKEISDLQAQIQHMATKHRLEARKILTPEQQQKLAVSSMGRGPGAGNGWGRVPCPTRLQRR
ncbi:MAG: Spy/CpxP family protein refolding chaperone [Thermodesulfobacteriota bacterium]